MLQVGREEEEEKKINVSSLTVATSRAAAKSNLIHCFILTFFFIPPDKRI
jgi:hypothetical protein